MKKLPLLSCLFLQPFIACNAEKEFVSLPIQMLDSTITITSAFLPSEFDYTRALLIGKIQKETIKKNPINSDTIKQYAKTFLEQHQPTLTSQEKKSKSENTNNAETFLAVLSDNIANQLEQKNIKTIDASLLDCILLHSLRSFFPLLALDKDFIKEVDTLIARYLKDNNLSVSTIPAEMKCEYSSRRIKLLLNFQKILDKRKTEHMPAKEMVALIVKTFETFIERALHVITLDWLDEELDQFDKQESKTNKDSMIPANPEGQKNRNLVPFLQKKNTIFAK